MPFGTASEIRVSISQSSEGAFVHGTLSVNDTAIRMDITSHQRYNELLKTASFM